MFYSETERLILRHMTDKDAEFILNLYNQAAFKQYIGDRGVSSLEKAYAFIKKTQQNYHDHGFWLYLIEERDSGNAVGVNGLVKRDYLNYPDIGFAISKEYWGQGYAYESGVAVLQHAADLEIPEVLAITSVDNKSSIGLLSKLGFADGGKKITPVNNEAVNLYRKVLTYKS